MTATGGTQPASPPLSFGPRQLVDIAITNDLADIAGCGACGDDGVIHAFWSRLENEAQAPPQQEPLLSYLIGPPGAISVYLLPDRGLPLAAAVDGETGTVHLLYSNKSGVHLAQVQADASFGAVRLLSGNQSEQGTLVADQGGWWAVWAEEDGNLYQAYGGWGNGDFPSKQVTSKLTGITGYGSPSLALGPRNPAHPGNREIHLSWTMTKPHDGPVVRLATAKVQQAEWGEVAWLPTAAMGSDFVGDPALVYDGVLQAAYVWAQSIGYTRNPSQTAPTQLWTSGPGKPYLAASAGRTLVAWADYDAAVTGLSSLWAAVPGAPAVNLVQQQPSDVIILSLTSCEGSAVLLTFEDNQSVYMRIQTS